jgi:hypothetical protein
MNSGGFTSTALLGAATEVLVAAGFQAAAAPSAPDIGGIRVFEDPYTIAAVAVYEAWGDLLANWVQAQSAVARLIAEHFRRMDAKVWEGYLVLLTPSIVPTGQGVEANDLRRNTQYLRKLLGTGEDISTLADVERVLLPLLPLPQGGSAPAGSALEMLPEILAEKGVSRSDTEVVVRAFGDQQPVVERLHEHLLGDHAAE